MALRVTQRLALALALLLSANALGAANAEASLRLRLAFAPSLAIEPRAEVEIAGQVVTLTSAWSEITLPLGTHPLVLLTPGLRLSDHELVVSADAVGARAEHTLRLTPELRLEAPTLVDARDGRALVRVSVASDAPYPIPFELHALDGDGIEHRAAQRLRAVAMQGVSPHLDLDLRVAHGAAPLALDLEPFGITHSVDWRWPDQAGWSLSSPFSALTVPAGASVSWPLQLHLSGGESGGARIDIDAPPGITANTSQQRVELTPEGEHALTIELTAANSERATHTITARLTPDDPEHAPRTITLELDIAPLPLDVRIDAASDTLLPGDAHPLRVVLDHHGTETVPYTLRWLLPEWLEPLGREQVVGVALPGERHEHVLDTRVRFGPPSSASASVAVEVGAAVASATAELRRAPLELDWEQLPQRTTSGQRIDASVVVRNPSGRTLEVEPLWSVAGAAERVLAAEPRWTLPPGLSRHAFGLEPDTAGPLEVELVLVRDGESLAHRLTRSIDVHAAALPERVTAIEHRFELSHSVDALLVRQPLPAGASVVSGASLLDGRPIADPVVIDDAAYWQLTGAAPPAAQLRFALLHSEPIEQLAAIELAARRGSATRTLLGGLSYADAPTELHQHTVQASDAGSAAAVTEEAAAALVILEPAADVAVRPEEAVRVVVSGPASAQLSVSLNGEPLPRSRLGLQQIDPTSGRQRLEYYGLEMRTGLNVIRVSDGVRDIERRITVAGAAARLELTPLMRAADGVTPVVVQIAALDAGGIPVGYGPVRIDADARPLGDDAVPDEPGFHVMMRDGIAVVRFEPRVGEERLSVRASFAGLEGRDVLVLEAPARTLWNAEGSLGASLGVDGVALAARGRGYLEASGAFGSVVLAVDAGAHRAADGAWSVATGLAPRAPDPLEGVLGAASDPPLRSDDGFAVRYRYGAFTAAYVADDVRVPGVAQAAYGSALRLSVPVLEGVALHAVAGWLPSDTVVEIVQPTGLRSYRLTSEPRPGSERVELVRRRDGVELSRTSLRAGVDYEIDTFAPAIRLARPLWSVGTDGHETVLEVRYVAASATRDALTFGAGVSLERDALRFEAGYLQHPHDGVDAASWGASAGVVAGGVDASVRVERRSWEDDWRARFDAHLRGDASSLRARLDVGVEEQLQLDARARLADAGVGVRADLSLVRDLPPSGSAALTWSVVPTLDLELEYRLASGIGRTRATLARTFGVGGMKLATGAGVRYDHSSGAWSVVTRADTSSDALSVAIEHEQALGPSTSRSALGVSVALAAGLDAVGEVDVAWGETVRGRVGLEWRDASGASIDVGVARPRDDAAAAFVASASAPLLRSDTFQVDVHGGFEHDLDAEGATRAALGASLSVTTPTWDARFAVDASALGAQPEAWLDASARWTPSATAALTIDGRWLFIGDAHARPSDAHARLSVAYTASGERWRLATHHDLEYREQRTLVSGQALVSYQAMEALQLRPGVAYRMPLEDREAAVVQGGFGVTLFAAAAERVNAGAVAYLAWAPWRYEARLALGAEIGYALVPGANLVLGYTVGEGPGLLAGGSPGVHMRIDVFGGSE